MLLSVLVFLPVIFALVVCAIPAGRLLRPVALGFSLIQFVVSLVVLGRFDTNIIELQMVEKFDWVKSFGISYFLGIDGISVWLVMLTTFMLPIMILGSWDSIEKKVKGFLSCLFLLQSAMLGTFLAMDTILFYVFWELSLVPMYFIVGIWGGSRRIYATVKFFIFTMAGSVLMLVAIIYMMQLTGENAGGMSASLLDFYNLNIPFVAGKFLSPQTLLFFAFATAFAIKVPVFPLHTWLPDAHVEAPTPGSVVLASVMLKMGTYGFIRFAIPLFPDAAQYWGWLFMLIGVVGIIYGALVAMVQTDIKKLVAYSSVSHMGYVIIGMFALNAAGVTGSIYQMLNHGISTGALFLLVGMIYQRTHSREIGQYGGLASALPIFTIFFFIVTLSSIAVPMTNGFVGEFLILLGTFETSMGFAIAAVFGVVLGAAYMLWMFKRVFFGAPGPLVAASVEGAELPEGASTEKLEDMSWREIAVMTPLVVLIFWMGLFPKHFFKYSEVSVAHFVSNVSHYQLAIHDPAKDAAVVARFEGEKNEY